MDKLLPCPFCGGEAEIIGGTENWSPSFSDPDSGGDPIAVVCNCGCGLYAHYDDCSEAIAAWNRRAQPENEPLTLDELKQMEGEPVFTVDGEGHSAWVVVNAKGECCADNEFGSWEFSYYEMMMPTVLTESENKLHPMGWLAYRYKPERSEG